MPAQDRVVPPPPAGGGPDHGHPAVGRRQWIGLVFIGLAVSTAIVDITIVNVAIPSIIADLGITATTAQWVQEGYVLTFAALLLVFGRIADRIGRRRTLVLGVVVFTLASVGAALARTGPELLGARAVQGAAAAAILPTTLSLVNATFPVRHRHTAFAVWGSLIGGMAAVGPLLGGWLATDHSWRWAFGINVPVGVVVVIGLLVTVAESRERDGRRGLDLVGAALSVLAAGLVVLALIEGVGHGWWRLTEPWTVAGWTWPATQVVTGPGLLWRSSLSPVPFVLAAALVVGLLFLRWERRRNRRGKVALLDLSLFRIRSFGRGTVVVLLVALGEFGILFAVPLWLQHVLGYTAFGTGTILLAMAAGSFLAGGAGAAMAAKVGPAPVVRLGVVLEIAGLVGIGAVVATDTPLGRLLPFLAVYGVGVGLATAQLSGLVLRDVPVDRSGQASGTVSTAQQLGSAFGIAVLGTVLFATTSADLTERLAATGPGVRDDVVTAVRSSGGAAIDGLAAAPGGDVVATAAGAAMSAGLRAAA